MTTSNKPMQPKPAVPWLLRTERAGARAMFLIFRTLVRSVRFERLRFLGAVLGELQFRLGFVARRRMVQELAVLLGRSSDDPKPRQQMREAYRCNDVAVLEVLKLLDQRQDTDMLLSQVKVDGVPALRAVLDAGRGAILLACHAGNGALLLIRLAALGFPVSMVYRESAMMDAGLFQRGLAFYDIEGILATDGLKAYGKMLGALRANRVVFVMADQGTKKARDGVMFKFLGKRMSMPAGPAQLARHARTPVLPVEITAAHPRWGFEILPPITFQLGATLEDDMETLLRVSESVIMRHPQWWSWHQRRWRRFPMSETRSAVAERAER